VEWLSLPGIGTATRKKILSKYRSREAFLKAPKEDLEILLGKKKSLVIYKTISEYKEK
jgi:excinuclease ABC subunit C